LSALRISSPVGRSVALAAFACPIPECCRVERGVAEEEEEEGEGEEEEEEERGEEDEEDEGGEEDECLDGPLAAASCATASAAESSGVESKARLRRRWWCAAARRDMTRWRLLVNASDCKATSTM